MKKQNRNTKNLSFNRLFVLGIAALICGCTVAMPTPGSEQLGKEKENWRIELAVSGGFAGVNKYVEVDSSGKARAMDRKRGLERESRATPPMITKLDQLVNELFSTPPSLEQKPKKRCYDCFEYRLTTKMATKTRSEKISGYPQSNSVKWQLIQTLVPFMEEVLTKE